MSKYSALIKRATSATTALALSLASLTPAVMLGSRASAGQMTERQINMSNSKATLDNNTYTLTFKPSGSSTVQGIVVEFCGASPIIGAACTGPTGLDVAGTTTPQTIDSVSFAVDSSTANKVVLTADPGASAAAADTYTITMNVDNPDAVGSFYARVLTYTTTAAATAYTSTAPGSYTDAGGIALSTTNDVTINARVQEQLTFCVGAVASASAVSNCGGITESVVDLGVLNATTTTTSPVLPATDGNEREGAFLVSTNAVSGVKIYYTSPNSLAVGATTCENANTSTTDQCINADASGTGFSAGGTEKFGMSLTAFTDNTDVAGEGTWTLATDYNGTNFSWNTTAQTEIASASTVVANDVYEMTFKANAALTTPSGYYTTTANFVATAKF